MAMIRSSIKTLERVYKHYYFIIRARNIKATSPPCLNFIQALDTPNIVLSTVSIETSFLAAALTLLRSSYYALGYAANDLGLIVLWILASFKNPEYIPVVINFAIFLFNDMYGFLCWRKRELSVK